MIKKQKDNSANLENSKIDSEKQSQLTNYNNQSSRSGKSNCHFVPSMENINGSGHLIGNIKSDSS